MSADNRSLHQRMKKFSNYLKTKVKETTHNILNDDTEDTRLELEHDYGHDVIIRRHSSYQPVAGSILENNTTVNQKKTPVVLKQDFNNNNNNNNQPHHHSSPITISALSPPPRQSKSKNNCTIQKSTQYDSNSSFTNSPYSSSSSSL